MYAPLFLCQRSFYILLSFYANMPMQYTLTSTPVNDYNQVKFLLKNQYFTLREHLCTHETYIFCIFNISSP